MAMTSPSDQLCDTARLWAIRVADADFGANADDWDGFTDWLAADPAHAAAYDRAVDATAAADALIGRASCRARVCQYVSISLFAVSLNKNKEIDVLYNEVQLDSCICSTH